MHGTLRKQLYGYQWMRVGSADPKFSRAFVLVSLFAVACLAVWVYIQLPQTALRPVYFLVLYLVAAALYLNLGVWIHEQLHGLPYRQRGHEGRLQIVYQRKYILALHGYCRAFGAIDYLVLRRSLLGPLGLVIGWLAVGWLGSFILPGWWFPLLATLAVVSALDMVHDFYWFSQTQQVGEKGRYWDNGHELEVVWKG
ncbi:MAG: hypothetical protein ACM33V_00090 [Chloroflexota bacterium]